MNEQQIQDIADRVIDALNGLAPRPTEPNWWEPWAAFGSYVALAAAAVAFIIGWINFRHQQRALRNTVRSDAANLRQKREADARSEWWKRTQWALEASASKDPRMYAYGTGMLDLLAQSELAGPKDKELLDAVWEGTDTEMQDEVIEQLIKDASAQEDLSYEELVSLMSFGQADFDGLERLKEHARNLSADDLEKMLKYYQEASAQDGVVVAPSQDPEDDSFGAPIRLEPDESSDTTQGFFGGVRRLLNRIRGS